MSVNQQPLAGKLFDFTRSTDIFRVLSSKHLEHLLIRRLGLMENNAKLIYQGVELIE